MKNIKYTWLGLVMVALLAACAGDSIEAKKAKIEELQSKQADIATQIATLQEDILKAGDSSLVEDKRAKYVALTPVSKQAFVNGIDVQGKVDGDENIVYSAKTPAVVSSIKVKVGDKVHAGQVLVELDGSIVKAQLQAIEKQFELAKTLFEKRKALWDQNVGSEMDYLQAKNAKESLEKQIAATRENLDLYNIKSDFNGTVDELPVKVGQGVAPGVPVVSVINPGSLKLKAQLSESYTSQVNTGNEVDAYFPDINKSVRAKVTHVSRTIDPMTRTFNVQVSLPNDEDLRPNMVAKIKFINYKNDSSIVVPINVIQQVDGEDVVFIADTKDGKLVAKKVSIKTGKMYNNLAEVLSGLNVGDQLITTGYQDLTDGQALKQ
jgi:membrane fusion protein (multidrug efflux system)